MRRGRKLPDPDVLIALLGRPIGEARKLALPGRPKRTRIDDRVHLVFRDSGIEFGAQRDELVTDIHLFGPGHAGFETYAGQLPLGLSFETPRKKVRSKLGAPATSGGGPSSKIKLIHAWPFDRFDEDSYCVFVEYNDEESAIRSIVIQPPIQE